MYSYREYLDAKRIVLKKSTQLSDVKIFHIDKLSTTAAVKPGHRSGHQAAKRASQDNKREYQQVKNYHFAHEPAFQTQESKKSASWSVAAKKPYIKPKYCGQNRIPLHKLDMNMTKQDSRGSLARPSNKPEVSKLASSVFDIVLKDVVMGFLAEPKVVIPAVPTWEYTKVPSINVFNATADSKAILTSWGAPVHEKRKPMGTVSVNYNAKRRKL